MPIPLVMSQATRSGPRGAAQGISGLLGSIDASLADAELLSQLAPAHAEEDPAAALLGALVERQGWSGAVWWRLERGRARAVSSVGAPAGDPAPRLGVGPLGRALLPTLPDGVRPVHEEQECPRCRLAARAGAQWAVALRVGDSGFGGVLELHGTPEGGIGPERVALLRHTAWLLSLGHPGRNEGLGLDAVR